MESDEVRRMEYYISIDIGGTAIKYGVISEDGVIREKGQMETQAHKGGPSIVEKVTGIVERYVKVFEPRGICISTAGMVDTKSGEIFHSAPLIPEYAGINYKRELESMFHIPCEVENHCSSRTYSQLHRHCTNRHEKPFHQ